MNTNIDAIWAQDMLEDVIDTALDFLVPEFCVMRAAHNEKYYIYEIKTNNLKNICKIKFFDTTATNKVEFSFIYNGKESDKYSLKYIEFKEKVPNVLRALKRKLFNVEV